MLICFFSDWRGKWAKLPRADLYVCIGNMLPNHPLPITEAENDWEAFYKAKICPRHETYRQGKYIRGLLSRRSLLGNPEAPIVLVRGNRDFVSLSKMFGGEVYEIGTSATIFHLGIRGQELRIGGFRGVSVDMGVWSDELQDEDLSKLVSGLPQELDILVTHSPAYGMMDHVSGYGGRPQRWGIKPLTNYLEDQLLVNGPLRVHAFGYVPSCFGYIHRDVGGRKDITHLNVATGFQLMEWDGTDVKVKEIKRNAIEFG